MTKCKHCGKEIRYIGWMDADQFFSGSTLCTDERGYTSGQAHSPALELIENSDDEKEDLKQLKKDLKKLKKRLKTIKKRQSERNSKNSNENS